MPVFGVLAAIPIRCKGDLWSPADDAPHEKRTVGRWLAAAEIAELIPAAPTEQVGSALRMRRNKAIHSDRIARADDIRPYGRINPYNLP